MSNNKINNKKNDKKNDKKNESDTYIQKLPLELIANIVQYLNLRDIIALTSVSKIWRSTYLNQNVIWKRICEELDIRDEDYLRNSPTFCTLVGSSSKEYMDFRATSMFGQTCHWWDTFICYHRILKYLRSNGYCSVKVPHLSHISNTYCFGDYVVNVSNKRSEIPVTITVLKGLARDFHNIKLEMCEMFNELFYKHIKVDKPKVVGNDKFLVIEIRSVIFVYIIENYEFKLHFTKVVHRDLLIEDSVHDHLPSQHFLRTHNDTKIAMYEDKLVVVHPKENEFYVINLKIGKLRQLIKLSKWKCYVDCVQFYKERVMIGVTIPQNDSESIVKHMLMIYDIEKESSKGFTLFGAANEIKVSESVIGIQNKPHRTIFIRKKNNSKFFLSCSTFDLDPYGKYIFYVNQNVLYKYIVSDVDPAQGTTIASSIQDTSCLHLINKHFLLLNKTSNLWYDVLDVKNKYVVKSIKYDRYRLVYVGRRFLVMADTKVTLIMGYCK
ncbi:uncharacterized protein LOC126836576 [Adelges cooleyi]|uniref:uncharacterized protein LOC126836576 n=1 Tax=Adelges cooleyi TaxID=133065 RepID=UPI0021804CA8|nr:uncharacterized protein LOC126836576 [Adelges cooleyi]